MIAPKVGELLRSRRTGEVFAVEKTRDERVILQSLDGSSQVLTEKRALAMFYEPLSQPPLEARTTGK